MNGLTRYMEGKLREEHAELKQFLDNEQEMAAEWHHDYHDATSALPSECGVCSTFRDKYARFLQLDKIIKQLDEIDANPREYLRKHHNWA